MGTFTQWVAVAAAVGVASLSIFQILLASGLPLGHAAFGGEYRVLPKKLRYVSALSAAIFLVAFYVILTRGGLLGRGRQESSPIRVGIWVLVAIFSVSALANVASRSRWERRLMAPVALVLALCCVEVALH
jgi:hypothetical protein